jgi:hypothetical protein
VQVASEVGTSDSVGGLGLGTPQEPDVGHHTSFGLTFRRKSQSRTEPADEGRSLLTRLLGWLGSWFA